MEMEDLMTIHYIAEYKPDDNVRDLSGSPAGVEKMNYIMKTVRNCGYLIAVFSTSRTMAKHQFYWIQKSNMGENGCIILRSTFSASNRVFWILDRIWAQLQILCYGLFCVSKKDVMLIYHERYYLPVIKLLKWIKQITIIYEIEEIYTIASECDSRDIAQEIKGLSYADGYLFSNDILAQKLGLVQKPFVVSYGSYQSKEPRTFLSTDGLIHVVYAGTLNAIKAGAVNSIWAAQFLDQQYHLHILGFGNNKEIQTIHEEIRKVAGKTSCKVTYDGCLSGTEYISFLQTCQIGLNAQNPKAALNEYSFPSKILTYMANGLLVIATKITVLEKSSICSQIVFAKNDSPESLADAIKSVKGLDGIKNQQILERLDWDFIREFKILMLRFRGD
jgi:hypothetical protein